MIETKRLRLLAAMKEYREVPANRARLLKQMKTWRENNRARLRRSQDAWNKLHPGRVNAIKARAYAKKKGATIFGDPEQLVLVYDAACCAGKLPCTYCGRLVGRKNRQVDHKLPLARGGQHVVDNLAIVCCTCNYSKRHRTAEEFLAWRLV